MNNRFQIDGYTFEKTKGSNKHRPYKVRCLETNDYKESAISYEDAASLLTAQYAFAKAMKEGKRKDEVYVKSIFSELLVGKKISQCDRLVEEEIVNKGKLTGEIVSVINSDISAEYKEYRTEFFTVKVLFENGLLRRATDVVVEKSKD